MGCSVTGIKPLSAKGPTPLDLGEMQEDRKKETQRESRLRTVARVVLGSIAGFYYFVLPIYMWLKNLVFPKAVSFAP